MTTTKSAASVDTQEIEKFAAQAEAWWDPKGNFRPLHRLNPTRLEFIRDRLAAHFDRAPLTSKPLSGLRLLDLGCGGGLLSEPLARMGASVTAIDAAADGIQAARAHAAAGGLSIDYRVTTAEALLADGAQFDAVVSMEVVEHVQDVGAFLGAAAGLAKPGGALLLSTLNRTPKSFMMAIVGAEYLLRWVPRGTHDWRRFLKPSELAEHLRPNGVEIREVTGLVYNPLSDSWRLDRNDLDVNYLLYAVRED
ncbi:MULTISPECIES: bifunctional 2-polyprenyl-6-hydroxyphenol methylase/3-demethylubiquinol 3-O-methyltransferase UbiG [Limibacillus]|uniref:Ubiquinone biosynthesis O-methyltransferase n=1 Tax=Limibacillus halophilus TaxID=1579333 RepID=A0A839SU13_9PROT|nr:bifunctional 2-polyprenyl-6-hydroxyphenol methylase/3-demethylubiquinol 3-O-methyltransferase UbiG [Limibacillus halophilus]MBB3066327.1 2-polyprenyl-6-hydroxyphenyl methylase/3-demethylubiquinone-9 3-methyltransferase [Limibacillus halophilus]